MSSVLDPTNGLVGAVSALVIEAAETAVLPRFRQLAANDIAEKAAGEFVTIADRDSEQIISAGLARLLPEAEIVGEEATDLDPSRHNNLGAPWCWIIDPLDGTANFASGNGPFGIMVALARQGEPVVGWIYDPRSRRLCVASKGHGLTIDGRRTLIANRRGDRPSAAISSLFSREPEVRAKLVAAMGNEFEISSMPRCAAEQYPQLVLGANDAALFQRTLPWDHAAGVLCVTEAGGRVSRLDGAAYRVDDRRDGLVAARSEACWSQVLALVACAGIGG